ncbi:hypothetical protein JZ751_002315 [Albula glossodonta]|uniref:Uncharacterized protein n=1 Tax=Albula glossodonta TaxID=121402 RepID=A0A8T2P8J4_9TELE|nr:hypothetical protein JZ751_002315 [Albula glossodonta]
MMRKKRQQPGRRVEGIAGLQENAQSKTAWTVDVAIKKLCWGLTLALATETCTVSLLLAHAHCSMPCCRRHRRLWRSVAGVQHIPNLLLNFTHPLPGSDGLRRAEPWRCLTARLRGAGGLRAGWGTQGGAIKGDRQLFCPAKGGFSRGHVLNDGQPHPPLGVLGQLHDGRQQGLRQLADADDLEHGRGEGKSAEKRRWEQEVSRESGKKEERGGMSVQCPQVTKLTFDLVGSCSPNLSLTVFQKVLEGWHQDFGKLAQLGGSSATHHGSVI